MRSIVRRAGWGDSGLFRSPLMFQSCDVSLARAVKLNVNSLEHRVQIARDLRIPETDDAISFPFEPKLPCTVTFGGFVAAVVSAVKFDDQVRGRTEEIHDIRTDRRLTAKVRAGDGKFAQGTPQDPLVRGRIRT